MQRKRKYAIPLVDTGDSILSYAVISFKAKITSQKYLRCHTKDFMSHHLVVLIKQDHIESLQWEIDDIQEDNGLHSMSKLTIEKVEGVMKKRDK